MPWADESKSYTPPVLTDEQREIKREEQRERRIRDMIHENIIKNIHHGNEFALAFGEGPDDKYTHDELGLISTTEAREVLLKEMREGKHNDILWSSLI